MRKAKIGGQEVTIAANPDLYEDAAAFGRWSLRLSRIELDSELDASAQGEVTIHEVFEAINQKFELGLKHPTITALGSAFHQFMRENPALCRDIISGRAIVKGGK